MKEVMRGNTPPPNRPRYREKPVTKNDLEYDEESSVRDFQTLERYSINTLISQESDDSPISKMLEYWLDLRDGDAVAPRADRFDYARLWRMKIPNRVTIANCAQENPSAFKFVYHAWDPSNLPWFYGAGVTGKRIAELPSKLHSNDLQTDYGLAKRCESMSALPYQRIRQRINGHCRDYVRLLLPFRAKSGTVTMLVAVTRKNSPVYFDPFAEPAAI